MIYCAFGSGSGSYFVNVLVLVPAAVPVPVSIPDPYPDLFSTVFQQHRIVQNFTFSMLETAMIQTLHSVTRRDVPCWYKYKQYFILRICCPRRSGSSKFCKKKIGNTAAEKFK
jgi:hypothetical protein